MSEQLALDELGGHVAAVNHHKAPLGPRAVYVDGPGTELLASAGLALDKHRDVAGLEHLQHGKQPPHGYAAADEIPVAITAGDGNGGGVCHRKQVDVVSPDGDASAQAQRGSLDAPAEVSYAVGAAKILHQDTVCDDP